MEHKIKNITNKLFSKTKIIFLFFTLFSVFIVPSVSDVAFANHLSEKLKWQIVFISSQPGCSNYHYQMMNKFYYITASYLSEYGLETEAYSPICLPQEKYPQDYKKPNDLDLFILVYDKNMGRDILQASDVGGFYKHFGFDITTNHVIVFCDCPNFNFSDPVWILTHELSHFSLFYLGYEESVIDNLVHEKDKAYDQCREDWIEGCEKIIKKLKHDFLGYAPSVMPLYQPAVEKNKINLQTQEITDEMIELSKLITGWWSTGQPIDNKGYAKAIQLLGSTYDWYKDNGDVEFADHPIKDEITWDEMLYGESKFDSSQIMPHIPFKLKSDAEINEELDDRLSNLPVWFKQTAIWWVEGNISDEEFVQSINYLKEEGLIDPYFDFRFLFKN